MNTDKEQKDTHIVVPTDVLVDHRLDTWLKAFYVLSDMIGDNRDFNIRFIIEKKFSEPDIMIK